MGVEEPKIPLRELLEHDIQAVDERLSALMAAMEELRKSERVGDKEAVEKALTAAKEVTTMHNGLLRRMEVLSETFPSKDSLGVTIKAVNDRISRTESVQNKMLGGLLILSFIGVTNLIRFVIV